MVQTWAACIVGFLSGLAYYGGSRLFLYMHIDDPVNAAAVHFCCGSVGGLSVGIFATEKGISAAYGILKPRAQGLIYSGDFTLLGTQVRLLMLGGNSALWSYLREARTSISQVEGYLNLGCRGGYTRAICVRRFWGTCMFYQCKGLSRNSFLGTLVVSH